MTGKASPDLLLTEGLTTLRNNSCHIELRSCVQSWKSSFVAKLSKAVQAYDTLRFSAIWSFKVGIILNCSDILFDLRVKFFFSFLYLLR